MDTKNENGRLKLSALGKTLYKTWTYWIRDKNGLAFIRWPLFIKLFTYLLLIVTLSYLIAKSQKNNEIAHIFALYKCVGVGVKIIEQVE